MTISRRQLIAGSAAASLGGIALRPRRAQAATFSYKLANNNPVDHPMNIRLKEAAAKIKSESGGRLTIDIFPNNQLGGDTDMLQQLRSGALEMFILSGLILATLVPVASINGIGFAFKDYDQVWGAMDGDLGNLVRAAILKSQLRAMSKMWDNGYRQITSSTHPIRTPADLRGFKIRVPVSPLWTSMFEAFGASPTSINFAEVYSSLQTKVVEGQENPLTLIELAKLYEVQKYCSLTGHMWDGFHCLANEQAWQALPKDLQEIAARNLDAAALLERADLLSLSNSVQSKLATQGLTFNTVDPQQFRATLKQAGFYAQWRKKYGDDAWRVLEKYSGPLA